MTLLRNGYVPLPCSRETKRPVIENWPDLNIGCEHIAGWDVQFPFAQNHGLRLPAVDIDILDEDVSADLEREVRDWLDGNGKVMVRFGRPPKRLVPINVEDDLTKLSAVFKDAADKEQRLEILGTRSQFVALGKHPDGFNYDGRGEVPLWIRLRPNFQPLLPTRPEGYSSIYATCW
jgi:hypothetical protein